MRKSFLGLFVAVAALSFTSCSDDDDSGNVNNNSRQIKYEITGNFTGDIRAVYTTASGGTTNAEITTLPWQLEFTAQNDVNSAVFAAAGTGGVAGQEVEVTIYQGGQEKGSVEAVVGSDGSFSASAPAVTF